MAVKLKMNTIIGEERELYVRVNHGEVNRGGQSNFLMRGYLYDGDKSSFAWEGWVSLDVNLDSPVWEQVYNKFKEERPESVDC